MKKNNLLLIFLFCISFVSAQQKEIIASSQPITINITTSPKEITGISAPTAINIGSRSLTKEEQELADLLKPRSRSLTKEEQELADLLKPRSRSLTKEEQELADLLKPIRKIPEIKEEKKITPTLHLSRIGSTVIPTDQELLTGFKTEEKEIILKGFLKQGENVKYLKLNNDDSKFSINLKTKTFSIDDDNKISLNQGKNIFTIEALDNDDKVLVSRIITIELIVPSSGLPAAKYYAILIACNEYENMDALKYPIEDAEKLKTALEKKYHFNKIEILKNPKSKTEIESFLVKFNRENLTEKDKENNNVIIFYAGHGTEKDNRGYWIPKEGNTEYPNTLVNTKSLQTDVLSYFNAKHILTIVDACYSGAICNRGKRKIKDFEITDREANERYAVTSQFAITSGNLKPVPDKSDFISLLLSVLNSNKESKITSEILFWKMKGDKSATNFRHCPLNDKEQGDFIFQLKKTK